MLLAYIGPGAGWLFSWGGALGAVVALAGAGAVIAEYVRRRRSRR